MTDLTDEQNQKMYQERAPGWDIRCLKCGFMEPWGKYGFRIAGYGRKWTFGRCSRCRRICCHVIEKRKNG